MCVSVVFTANSRGCPPRGPTRSEPRLNGRYFCGTPKRLEIIIRGATSNKPRGAEPRRVGGSLRASTPISIVVLARRLPWHVAPQMDATRCGRPRATRPAPSSAWRARTRAPIFFFFFFFAKRPKDSNQPPTFWKYNTFATCAKKIILKKCTYFFSFYEDFFFSALCRCPLFDEQRSRPRRHQNTFPWRAALT